MGISVWDPNASAGEGTIADSVLEQFVAAAQEAGDLVTAELLSRHGLEGQGKIMMYEPDTWKSAETLDDDMLVALVRFFTLVEMQISGWDAGNKSPVIPLVKILKSRDAFSTDLRKWIKSSTTNRYLPYGSAL